MKNTVFNIKNEVNIMFVPEFEQLYFYVSCGDNGIKVLSKLWNDDNLDFFNFSVNNCFNTEIHALNSMAFKTTDGRKQYANYQL